MSQALDHLDFFAHAPDRHIGKVYLCFSHVADVALRLRHAGRVLPDRPGDRRLDRPVLVAAVLDRRPRDRGGRGWGDYLFHVREQLSPKGLAAMFGLPLVIAGAATATHALL
jgi:hypothetical protein